MAGNVQVNLERKVGNTRLQRLGNAVKQYATRVAIATALVAGAGYLSGCPEPSECCKELKCGSGYTCKNHYDDTCECEKEPHIPYQTQEFGLTMDDVFEDDTFR